MNYMDKPEPRYATCAWYGQKWNVSAKLKIKDPGYKCPRCRELEVKEYGVRYEDRGRCVSKPGAIVVYAYRDNQPLPNGRFYGYVRGDTVKLYPMDLITRSNYKGSDLDITIFDLKARRNQCT